MTETTFTLQIFYQLWKKKSVTIFVIMNNNKALRLSASFPTLETFKYSVTLGILETM